MLPRVAPYKWCGQIAADIPQLREAIRLASMADLRDFLEDIRRLSPQVRPSGLETCNNLCGSKRVILEVYNIG